MNIVIAVLSEPKERGLEAVPGFLPALLYGDRIEVLMPSGAEIKHEDDPEPLPIREDAMSEEEIKKIVLGYEKAIQLWDQYPNDPEARYLARLEELISQPSAYPILYDPEGVLLRTAKEKGMILTAGQQRRSAQATIGNNLLIRLPTFPRATVKETLEIRKELRPYVMGFRSALVSFGEKIGQIPPWNKEEIDDVIQDIYVGQVLPQVTELQQQVQKNKYLRQLTGELVKSSEKLLVPVAATWLTLAVNHLLDLQTAISAMGMAASIWGGSALVASWNSISRADELKVNKLYFLYEVEQRLQK